MRRVGFIAKTTKKKDQWPLFRWVNSQLKDINRVGFRILAPVARILLELEQTRVNVRSFRGVKIKI